MNIIRAGGYMLISVFLILVVYYVSSPFFTTFFDHIDDIDAAEATDEIDNFLPNIRTALNIAFAVAVVAPVIIFVMRTFEREPDWSYYRRY
jgi:Sec-independent protein secretion pathway component TatC